MHSNGFASNFLRAAAEKALQDIRKDPRRGLSNLLSLAKLFLPGQDAVFEQARRELDKENSALVAVVGKLVRKTDSEILLNFGLNLVCQGLDKGIRKIKALEAEHGRGLPWCLNWMLDEQNGPEPARLAQLITEGREFGIYCHMLRLGPDYPEPEQVARLPQKFPDCCFIFLAPPALLSSSFLAPLRGRAALLALDLDAESAAVSRAVGALTAGQFLAAAQLAYHEGQSHDLRVLEQICRQQDLDLLLLIEDWQSRGWAKKSALANQVQAARSKLEQPPLIFDLWLDLADLGQLLNPGARLAVVSGNLELRLYDPAGLCSCFDLSQAALASVLLRKN